MSYLTLLAIVSVAGWMGHKIVGFLVEDYDRSSRPLVIFHLMLSGILLFSPIYFVSIWPECAEIRIGGITYNPTSEDGAHRLVYLHSCPITSGLLVNYTDFIQSASYSILNVLVGIGHLASKPFPFLTTTALEPMSSVIQTNPLDWDNFGGGLREIFAISILIFYGFAVLFYFWHVGS